jgi:hypothetical protein
MARDSRNLSKSEKVAETAMPGWKAVREISPTSPAANEAYLADSASTDVSGTADSIMPTTEELKAKYRGAARSDSTSRPSADTRSDEADTALVEMESGPLKKTVAISKSRKKLIWSQG